MSDGKLLWYRLKWIVANFPDFWKTLDRANQLALVLIPLGVCMAILGISLADLVIGISLGIFVTHYLQRTEHNER